MKRYRDTISVKKRGGEIEIWVLNAFLRHPICTKTIANLSVTDFAAYRDKRLQEVQPITLQRQLAIIQNLYEIARIEWDLPIRENPIERLRLECVSTARERRLRLEFLDWLKPKP